MDFRPKLYKVAVSLLLGIIWGVLYYRWHLSYEVDRFGYYFTIGFIFIMVITYVLISLTEERW